MGKKEYVIYTKDRSYTLWCYQSNKGTSTALAFSKITKSWLTMWCQSSYFFLNTYTLFVLFVVVLCHVCPMLLMSLDCSFLIGPPVFSNVYLFCLSLFCVMCAQCCWCLWIVHSWLALRFSLTFICFVCRCSVSCVPNVADVSGLFILDWPFGFL